MGADGAAVDGTCIRAHVTASEPVEVAAAVASKHGASLAGVGQASGTAVTPTCGSRTPRPGCCGSRPAARGFVPGNGASIARARWWWPCRSRWRHRFGWPDKKIGWKTCSRRYAAQAAADRHRGADPGRRRPLRPAGSPGRGGQRGAATPQQASGALRALAASARRCVRTCSPVPAAGDPTTIASASARAALRGGRHRVQHTKPPMPLAALYLEPPPPPLDYPYAVLPGIDRPRRRPRKVLFEVLSTRGVQERLAAQSLRAPDGNWGDGFEAPQGAPSPAGGDPSAAPPRQGGPPPAVWTPEAIDGRCPGGPSPRCRAACSRSSTSPVR